MLDQSGMMHEHEPGMLQSRLLTGCEEVISRPYILAS